MMHVISKKIVSESPCLARYFFARPVSQYKTVYNCPSLRDQSYHNTSLQKISALKKLSTCSEDETDTILPYVEPVMLFDDTRAPLYIMNNPKILYGDYCDTSLQKISALKKLSTCSEDETDTILPYVEPVMSFDDTRAPLNIRDNQEISFSNLVYDLLLKKKQIESIYKDTKYAINKVAEYVTNNPDCINEFFKKYQYILDGCGCIPYLSIGSTIANIGLNSYQGYQYLKKHIQNDQKITLKDDELRRPAAGIFFTLGACFFPCMNWSSLRFSYNRCEDIKKILLKTDKDVHKINKDEKEQRQRHTPSNTLFQQLSGIKYISLNTSSLSSPQKQFPDQKTGGKSQGKVIIKY